MKPDMAESTGRFSNFIGWGNCYQGMLKHVWFIKTIIRNILNFVDYLTFSRMQLPLEAEAQEMGLRLIRLLQLVYRPIPKDENGKQVPELTTPVRFCVPAATTLVHCNKSTAT